MLDLLFSVPSQEIGWEEHVRNDLFCVEWDVIRSVDVFMCACKLSLLYLVGFEQNRR